MKNVIDMNEFYRERECGGFEYITESTLPNYEVDKEKYKIVESVSHTLEKLANMENAPDFGVITNGFSADDGDALVCIEVPLPISVFDANVKLALAQIIRLVDFSYVNISEDRDALRIVLDIDSVYKKIK